MVIYGIVNILQSNSFALIGTLFQYKRTTLFEQSSHLFYEILRLLMSTVPETITSNAPIT